MPFLLGLACLLCLGTPATIYAHGAGYGIDNNSTSVILRFLYAGNQPMSYAQVRIFGPGDQQTPEFQNGRTDFHGRFAFVPDRSGVWRVEANDGMGHVVFADVDVPDDPEALPSALSGQAGINQCLTWKIISGIAIIFLLFMSLGLLMKAKSGKMNRVPNIVNQAR